MQEPQEGQVWSLGWEDPQEEGTATHSSVLAWRIPWTEEPDVLQSKGSQRVGHDWSNSACTHTHLLYSFVLLFISIVIKLYPFRGFLAGSEGGESACNERDPGLIPWSGRSPGEGNGYPQQYSCMGNPIDRGAWRATVHRVAESWTWLSN